MDWCHYRFRTLWVLDAPPDRVYAVLERAEEYPLWWPQVREAARTPSGDGRARFRSVLPYDLLVTARQLRGDPRAGVLETELSGDLEGWARWTVAAHGDGTHALFEQQVTVRARLLRLLAVPGRPLFRANHWLMMRGGLRGLRARLEGAV